MSHRRRTQQGAVAVVMALIVTAVLIPMSALAVDIGMQRVARRDMQSIADVVALDLARQLNGGKRSTYSASVLDAVVADSLERNAVRIGTGANGKNADVTYKLGTTDASKYGTSTYFTEVTDPNSVPTAVQVAARTTVGFGLAKVLPGGGVGSGSATRYAVAVGQSSACFHLGSYAAAISSGNSALLAPLNSLLGLNLSLLSYQGLANAGVRLADLAADASIGSVDALLGSNVTLGSFTAAALNVLNKDPSGNAAAISALQAIRVSGINLSKKVDVAKIISLQQTDTAALDSKLNVLDLVSSAIQVANGDHAVDISGLNIAGITGDVKVTQNVQHACGAPNDPKAVARSSQLSANLNIPLTFPTGNSVLGLAVSGNVAVSGGLGNAVGRLVSPPSIHCSSTRPETAADPTTYRVDVNGGLLGLGVQANLMINGTVSSGLLGGLLDALLGVLLKVEFDHVTVSLGTNAPGTSASTVHADLKVPQNQYDTPRGTPVKTGSAYGGLGTVPNVTTSTAVGGTIRITTGGLLGLGPIKVVEIDLSRGGGVGNLINTLLGTVNGVLNTVVNGTVVTTLNNLLTPLATLLGVNAGGADVYSHSGASCNGTKLVG